MDGATENVLTAATAIHHARASTRIAKTTPASVTFTRTCRCPSLSFQTASTGTSGFKKAWLDIQILTICVLR